jgi:coenzyme F420 hydrogenase subunit beta
LADISLGDAWLPEITRSDTLGTSVILCRTEIGERVMSQAAKADRIILRQATAHEVIRTQHRPLAYKKRGIRVRIGLMRKNARTWADALSGLPLLKPKALDYLSGGLTLFSVRISRNPRLYPLLLSVPKALHRLYGLGIAFLTHPVSVGKGVSLE